MPELARSIAKTRRYMHVSHAIHCGVGRSRTTIAWDHSWPCAANIVMLVVSIPTGDAAAKERLDTMVSELAKVQAALGSGYLSAFPREHFDRVENLQGVWAPYYVVSSLDDTHCYLTFSALCITITTHAVWCVL